MPPARLLDGLLPALALLSLGELALLGRRRFEVYDWRETLASIGVAAGQKVANLATFLVMAPVFGWLWERRLGTIPLDRPWGLALLFLGVELAYYAQHRASHQIRWCWASHAVHHSSERINLSAAYRLGWTDLISGLPFFLAPLVLVGFAPRAVFVSFVLLILYQFWLHTELVPPLGRFDRIFNSPSNHRVHHATEAGYLGRNYGGVLVLFDRAFGTYAAERAGRAHRYGLVTPLGSHQPFVIVFHEWRALLGDLVRSRSWREARAACLGRPASYIVRVGAQVETPAPMIVKPTSDT